MKGSAFSAPTLSPVGLDLCSLLGIPESVVPILLRGEGGRSVAVEDVVFGLESNSLGELVAVR